MGTKKQNNVYKFSDCLTEVDTAYPGNGGWNSGEQPDFESCRASCRSLGAQYFTHNTNTKKNNKACWCKNGNANKKQQVGKVSGATQC